MDAGDVRLRHYLDFSGMAALRAGAQREDASATRETARQFEGILLQQMLAAMRAATPRGELLGSQAIDTVEAMFDRELVAAFSRRGDLGFADQIVRQVERAASAAPAADALAARAAMRAGAPPREPVSLDRAPPAAMPLDRAAPAAMPLETRPAAGLPLRAPGQPASTRSSNE